MKNAQRKKAAGKAAAAAAYVILAAAVLSGCGENVTAESLMQDAAEKMAGINSMTGVYDMDMAMEISQSGVSMNVDTSMNMDFETTVEPSALHGTATVDVGMLGLSMEMEMYTMMEGEQAVSYTRMGDRWMKQSVDMPESAASSNMVLDLDNLFGENPELTLQDDTEEKNGEEVYVITGSVSAEDLNMDEFNEIMGSVNGAGLEDLGLDLSGLQMDVTLTVYKDSHLPASLSMKSSGEGDVFTMDVEGVEAALTSLSYDMTFEEYDTVDEIVLPEEAEGAVDLNEAAAMQSDPAYLYKYENAY